LIPGTSNEIVALRSVVGSLRTRSIVCSYTEFLVKLEFLTYGGVIPKPAYVVSDTPKKNKTPMKKMLANFFMQKCSAVGT
jgi:hypothetical protein